MPTDTATVCVVAVVLAVVYITIRLISIVIRLWIRLVTLAGH